MKQTNEENKKNVAQNTGIIKAFISWGRLGPSTPSRLAPVVKQGQNPEPTVKSW